MRNLDSSTLDEINRLKSKADALLRWAIWLSILWIASILLYLVANEINIYSYDIGDFGNFLAGVASPLALAWLVVGYYLQRIELRQNTLALLGQYDELHHLVEANRDQVNISKQDIDLKREQINRQYEIDELKDRLFLRAGAHYMSGEIGHRQIRSLSLTNEGKVVSSVKITILNPSCLDIPSKSEFVLGNLERNKHVNLGRIKSESELPNLRIDYVGYDSGKNYTNYYKLVRDKDNSNLIHIEPDKMPS